MGDEILQTVLVMRLYPYKIFLACAVPKKGIDTLVTLRIARFIRDMGLVHFAYRNDREASFNAMIEEACARTGRTGKPVAQDDIATDFPYPVAPEQDDEPDAPTHPAPASSSKHAPAAEGSIPDVEIRPQDPLYPGEG